MKAAEPKYVAAVRLRLSNISSFMAALSENIGRRANREDGVSGRFWESRFGARKCTDEAAVIVCGIYVDLNQIRACEATTPEESTHTSAYDRIDPPARRQTTTSDTEDESKQPGRASWLCPLTFVEDPDVPTLSGVGSTTPWRVSDKGIIPLSLAEYLQLLEFTGRQLRADKPGVIPSDMRPILERLHIRPDRWPEVIQSLGRGFRRALGRLENLVAAAMAAGQHWLHGIRQAAELFT